MAGIIYSKTLEVKSLIINRMCIIISLIYIVVCLILSGVFMFQMAMEKALVVPCPRLSDEEREEVKSIHKFHGIMASEEDEWGREFFYRDNKKCWIDREGDYGKN